MAVAKKSVAKKPAPKKKPSTVVEPAMLAAIAKEIIPISCHVFSGLGGPFTDGGPKSLEKLIEDLSSQFESYFWHHNEWQKALKKILYDVKVNKNTVIILIGHSYGAKRCQQIAAELAKQGIRVAYIAAIDPTALLPLEKPMIIGTNVDFVDEFWSTKRGFINPPLTARKNRPDGSAGGKFVYLHNIPSQRKQTEYPVAHIPIASYPPVVARIIEQVSKAIMGK